MCEDAWLATAALIPLTERVKFLVAFRPGLLSPTLAAQMASTYQRLSGGRLLLNLVTGAEPSELARFGDFADKDTRYERTGEFIVVMRGAWAEAGSTTTGATTGWKGPRPGRAPTPCRRCTSVARPRRPSGWPRPRPTSTWRGASRRRWSPSASSGCERSPTEAGRTLGFGIRFHVITRPTADEAWAVADRLLAGMDPAAVAAAQADFARTQSEGQRRMASLHADGDGRLEIHPNVWAGIGLVRGGAGTALVGSYEEVADRIEEYHAVGFDEFILSGYPHLEEAYWFGEGVLPVLRARGLVAEPAGGPGGARRSRRSAERPRATGSSAGHGDGDRPLGPIGQLGRPRRARPWGPSR